MSSVIEQVKEIVASTLGVESDKLNDNTHLMDDLNVDSLGKMELVMKLEEEFDIEIPDSENENIMTIKAIASYVESKK